MLGALAVTSRDEVTWAVTSLAEVGAEMMRCNWVRTINMIMTRFKMAGGRNVGHLGGIISVTQNHIIVLL